MTSTTAAAPKLAGRDTMSAMFDLDSFPDLPNEPLDKLGNRKRELSRPLTSESPSKKDPKDTAALKKSSENETATNDHSTEEDYQLDNAPPRKAGRKMEQPPLESKRRAQNRAAQRAFRERRERYLKELENRIHELENESMMWRNTSSALRSKVSLLESQLTMSHQEQPVMNQVLPQPGFNSMNSNNVQPLPNQMFGVHDPAYMNTGSSPPNYMSAPRVVQAGPFTFSYPFDKTKQTNGSPVQSSRPILPSAEEFKSPLPGPQTNTTPYMSYSPASPNQSTKRPITPYLQDQQRRSQPDQASQVQSQPMTQMTQLSPQQHQLQQQQSNQSWEQHSVGSVPSLQSPALTSSPDKHELEQGLHSSASDSSSTPLFETPGSGVDEFCENLSLACPNRQLPYLIQKGADISDIDFLEPDIVPRKASSAWSDMADPLEALDLPDLMTNDYNFFDPLDDLLSGNIVRKPKVDVPPKAAPEPKPQDWPSMVIRSGPDENTGTDDDDTVPAATGKLMTCLEVWDRVSTHPRFNAIDMESLCSELRTKARCSDTGVVLPEAVLENLLTKQ